MYQVCSFLGSITWCVGYLYFSRPRNNKISCSVLCRQEGKALKNRLFQQVLQRMGEKITEQSWKTPRQTGQCSSTFFYFRDGDKKVQKVPEANQWQGVQVKNRC